MTIAYERKTAAGKAAMREIRAEAVYVRLAGEGHGAHAINQFYRSLGERFLSHCTERLFQHSAEGRFTARMLCTAEEKENLLCVQTEYLLCRRGRIIAAERENLCWQLPEGYLIADRRRLVEVPKGKLTNLRILPKKGKELAQ